MPLTTGINHLAVLTGDLDALIAFYTEVFDAAVVFEIDEDGLRHAALDLGCGASLHAFAVPDNPHAAARGDIFNRGHLDHVALNVPNQDALDEASRRLVERGASDGVVTDFGVLKSICFRDPDGLEVEVALWGAEPVRRLDERITTALPN
jgi:catechol 2,3-dioxygenase-like lactoylglutathione lyase family enzyme